MSISWVYYEFVTLCWVCWVLSFCFNFYWQSGGEITRKIPLQRTCRSSYTLAVLLPGIPDASPTDEQFCFVSDKICKWMFMYPGILLGYSMSIYIYILYIYILHIHTYIYIYINIYIYTQPKFFDQHRCIALRVAKTWMASWEASMAITRDAEQDTHFDPSACVEVGWWDSLSMVRDSHFSWFWKPRVFFVLNYS